MRLDGDPVWPLPEEQPSAEHDPHPRGRGSGAARLRLVPGRSAPARAVHAPARPGARLRRGRRSGPTRASSTPASSRGRTACSCAATRCTPTRSRPRRPSSSAPAATRRSRPARRSPTSRSTPASTAKPGAIPTSAGCSRRFRASMIFDDHDVDRRLEHLVAVAPGRARAALVARADHGGVHGVLDLPAPRQHVAPRRSKGEAMYQTAIAAGGDVGRVERFAEGADRESAATRWACCATSDVRACSWSTPAPPGFWTTTTVTWWTRRSGPGSSTEATRRSTTW